MDCRKLFAALFVTMGCALAVAAQSPAAATTPAGKQAGAPGAPVILAVVNNQQVTLADLSPELRTSVENLDKDVADVRRRFLELQIGRLLLEAEAKKKNMTPEQFVKAEISSKITDPTEEEIKALYDANRGYFGTADLAQARPVIIQQARNRRGQQLLDEYMAGLRKSYAVVMGQDVNAPNLAPATVLATAAGQKITAGSINDDARIRRYIYEMRMQTYEAERQAVNVAINNILLAAEAKRLNTTPEALMKTEVADKITHPTEADVAKFYEDNKERMGGADLATARPEIVAYLEQPGRAKLEQALVERLRAGAQIRLLMTEPEPLVEKVSADDDPSRGATSAPVTVIEFTDFQCPACAAIHPVLDEMLKTYGNRVRFVVRDFPLEQHAQARKAAEAANAANAQGKFFEYAAVLFKNQSALDVASLKKYAAELGLDQARFNAALDAGTYAAEVQKDVADGEEYAVEATPTIFVNGVRLRDLSPEGLRAGLERALAKAR
ncbi:MAG TPA: thioredoxin domain-containing protein [Pyrinomonadaceae bacterium]|jgi:protein-disulfide isomerase|nr:thioredoxin domain-containing protein [Pyrinomonadaceae bacterium]